MEIKNIGGKLNLKTLLGVGDAQKVKNNRDRYGLGQDKNDKLEISGESSEFFGVVQSMKKAVEKTAGRKEIEELREQIGAGGYRINYKELASHMID